MKRENYLNAGTSVLMRMPLGAPWSRGVRSMAFEYERVTDADLG